MTDAGNPAGAQAVADSWSELAAGLDESADLFRQAMLDSTVGWTGEAAEGMREQLAKVAVWSKMTAAQYKAASTAITEQSAAAHSAKTSMPPPVPYDPAQMIANAVASGSISQLASLPYEMYAQKQKHDAAHDQAADIVANRDLAFASSAATVPAFVPPPSLTNEGNAAEAPMPAESAPAPDGPVGSADPGPEPEPVGAAPEPSGAAPGSTVPASAATGPSSFVPAPEVPAAAAPAPTPGPGAPNPLPGGGFGTGGPGPGFGPGGPHAGPVPGQTRASAARGPATGTGFGPGSAAAVARPTPGAKAAAGLGGGVPMGTPRAEEAEHKRPEYLIEPDAENMFGSIELTAPPVIGEG